jgi:NADH:ubiquinone oxidoreductase subunit 6 (subunit J)
MCWKSHWKKYSRYFSSVYVKLIKVGAPAVVATMSANAKIAGINMVHSANYLNSEFLCLATSVLQIRSSRYVR